MDLENHNPQMSRAGCIDPDQLDKSYDVAIAKARLLELTGDRPTVSSVIRQHPLACVAVSFTLGVFLTRGTNILVLREGVIWALRVGLASVLRT